MKRIVSLLLVFVLCLALSVNAFAVLSNQYDDCNCCDECTGRPDCLCGCPTCIAVTGNQYNDCNCCDECTGRPDCPCGCPTCIAVTGAPKTDSSAVTRSPKTGSIALAALTITACTAGGISVLAARKAK